MARKAKAATGITPYVSKPLTSGQGRGRFCKQEFAYAAEDAVYRCSVGKLLTQRYTARHLQKETISKIKYKLLHRRLLADLARLALLHFDGFVETKCKP